MKREKSWKAMLTPDKWVEGLLYEACSVILKSRRLKEKYPVASLLMESTLSAFVFEEHKVQKPFDSDIENTLYFLSTHLIIPLARLLKNNPVKLGHATREKMGSLRKAADTIATLWSSQPPECIEDAFRVFAESGEDAFPFVPSESET